MNGENNPTADDLDLLVRAALSYAEIRAHASCFCVNKAGLELIHSSAVALPVIEKVLQEVVDKERPTTAGPRSPFIGLNYVLCAYLFIGMKNDLPSVIAFLKQSSRPLLTEAIAGIPILFQWTKAGYNFGEPPSTALLQFLQQLAKEPDEAIRQVAQSTLQKLNEAELKRQAQSRRDASI